MKFHGDARLARKDADRCFNLKDHRVRVRRFYFFHQVVGGLARADHAFGRKNKLVVGCFNIFGGELRCHHGTEFPCGS